MKGRAESLSFRALRRPPNGSAPGFRAEATWYPDAQLLVVVVGNTTSLPAAELAGELANEVLPPPVTQSPRGLAFSPNGGRAEPLPWVGDLTFYAGEDVTLTFRRAHGDSGPVTELRRDDGGNLYILKKQP
jgi:hypothetical protein